MVMFRSIFSICHGLSLYLTFMGSNLENMKKLVPIQTMHSVRLYSKNIVNNVGIFNNIVFINSNVKDEQCFLHIFGG